jgi:hypothetical protein
MPIPGVALTGYGMDDDLQKSTEAGFADHVLAGRRTPVGAILSRVTNSHSRV